MIKFKLKDHPNQKFMAVMNGKRISFKLWHSRFNDRLSIDVDVDEEAVIRGKRVQKGVNLLYPYTDLGAVFAITDGDRPISRETLSEGKLFLYGATKDEVDAAVSA